MEKRILKMVRMSEPHHDDGGLLSASGPTVPTDGTAGYRTGCIFQHSDGGEGTALYQNEGTVSSCDFNAIAALTAAQEALLGATAGTVTASMAVIVDANKDIGTFRDVTGRSFSSTGAIATGLSVVGATTSGLAVTTSTPTQGILISAACSTAAINISGAEAIGLSINTSTPTDGINIAAACANGIAIGGANTTAGINISGAEAVGLSINTSTPTDGILISAACETAALDITGAEAIGISINTSTPTDGINIAAACANAIAISGANTVAGVSVSGDQVLGYLFHATAAATAAFAVTIPTGITLDAGMDINATSTGVVTSGLTMQGTGTFTTGITLSATAITTGIAISAGSMTDAIKISGTTPVDGVEVSSACSAAALHVSGAQTGSALRVASTWALGFSGAALDVGGASTIAFGSVADSVVLARYDVTAQMGTAEKYVIGEYKTYATSGAGAGTVLQHGIWIGDYCKLTIGHNTTDAYATRGRTVLSDTMAGNQFIGVMGQMEITGAATLEATGGGYGVYGSVTSSGSGTCNRNVAAGYFTMRPNTINLVGDQSCVVADMGGSGYADYGFLANVGNNNVAEAAIGIQTTDSAVLPYAIKVFSTSGSITNLFRFTSASTAPVSAGGTVGTHGTATVKIAIDINGTTYYLLASTVPTFT